MRCPRTRYIKVVVLITLVTFILVQLIGSSGIGFGRRPSSTSDDLSRSQHISYEDSQQQQQQHLFKLNALNLLDLSQPSTPAPQIQPNVSNEAGNGNNNKPQNRNDDNVVQQDETYTPGKSSGQDSENDKKPINSLSGERTHGFTNASGSPVVNGKDGDGSNLINITSILAQMEKLNQDEMIRNEDLFGPVTNDTLVIVIQVHNRLQYLRHLIVSLSQAKEIDRCLLIFSHDFWDESINQLISSIDFTKTLQIFYPFSIQTHPNQFPGESPNDCPRNAKKDQAKRLQCTNANWPDLYGHYREAKFTQTKHHWWWKANRVFDQLKATKHYNGMVLFLEEDHYVAEDFVSVLRLAETVRDEKHPDCDIICIGTYLKSYNYNRDHKTITGNSVLDSSRVHRGPGMPSRLRGARTAQLEPRDRLTSARKLLWAPSNIISSVFDVFRKDFLLWPGGPVYSLRQRIELTKWVSSKHNMGMAFNRNLWTKIHQCRENFCNFDDYNWDWSLEHISNNCIKDGLQVLLFKGPRVFHIGECGVHHKKKTCEAGLVVQKVRDILSRAEGYLYPKELVATRAVQKKRKLKLPKGNGGWGDQRDHELCLKLSQPVPLHSTTDVEQS